MGSAARAGRVALVTGSARGIGRAVALELARAGAEIVVNYRGSARSAASARELCEEIAGLGRRAVVVAGDISEREVVRRLVAAAREQFGGLDVLVLNAARAPFKPIERLLERELRQLVDTNFIGQVLCVREALPLLEQGHGTIVLISSLGSRFFAPSYPLGSMKAAMEAVVRDLAEGLRPRGIAVNAVCGGLVRTDSFKLLRHLWEGLDRVPEELLVTPEEIAEVVGFLCSPSSRGIRGQTIVVDRGLSNRLGLA